MLLERGRDRRSRRTNDDDDGDFKKPGEAKDVCSLDFGSCPDPTLSHREVMSNGGNKRRRDLYEATDKKLKAKSGNAERAGMEICEFVKSAKLNFLILGNLVFNKPYTDIA